ncbi:MAG TPA: radical SAM protein [Candidatus Moranbacteria bacterium]|nr:radical SAM protein [Candidatus Moranbacteria bacterium]
MAISKKINPNILVTEFCNMACPYCFAKDAMAAPSRKEMGLADFRQLLVFLKNNHKTEVRLMGGEPTLHYKFKEIIDLAISYNFKVKIFTNGLFSEELAQWMVERAKSLEFIFNVTAGALASESIKKNIEKNLNILKNNSTITGSITIDNAGFQSQKIIDFVKNSGIKFIRIGLANNRINSSGVPFKDYEKHIEDMLNFIDELRKIGISRISLGCGLVPCIFTPDQLNGLSEKNIDIRGWGCAGKVGAFDISADLSIFPCFIMEDLKKGSLLDFYSLKTAKKYSDELSKYLVNNSKMPSLRNCKKCDHFLQLKCNGPCLGYVSNNKKDRKKLDNFKKSLSFRLTNKILYWLRNWA